MIRFGREWQDLRRRETVESEQEGDEPEDGVGDFDGKFGDREEQGEQADVPGDGERAERSQVSSVFQRDQAEGYDDEQDGFFVHVPAEKEGGVGAEGGGCHEICPGGAEEEFDKRGLRVGG